MYDRRDAARARGETPHWYPADREVMERNLKYWDEDRKRDEKRGHEFLKGQAEHYRELRALYGKK